MIIIITIINKEIIIIIIMIINPNNIVFCDAIGYYVYKIKCVCKYNRWITIKWKLKILKIIKQFFLCKYCLDV